MGRGKVELKRIEKQTRRQVTFSKRKNGLLKKAFELSILCDAQVALLIFSSSGKVYQFASHDMDRIIGRYRSEVGLPESSNQRSPTMEFWMNEIEDLKFSTQNLEARLRHLRGEDLFMLSMKELKTLERQLKIGVERIRSKMRRIITEHINLLKRRQRALQEENTRLHKEVKLLEEKHDSAVVATSRTLASSANTITAFPSSGIDAFFNPNGSK